MVSVFFFNIYFISITAVSQSNLHVQHLCQEHTKLLQNNPHLLNVSVLQPDDNFSEKHKTAGDNVMKCS